MPTVVCLCVFQQRVIAGHNDVLHRRAHALSRDMKEAEKRLAEEPDEINWARFLDVQRQLAALDGTEALVEGFGAASGRPARTM